MKNTSPLLKYPVFVAAVIAFSSVCSAVVLLDDTWADASCVEPNLPNESPVWVGYSVTGGGGVTMSTGSLAYKQSTSSQKLWTYFRAEDNPVSLGVGEQIIATIEFTPRGALYDNSSRGFRFGLFNDPTNNQILSNTNSDSGGTGDPWTDATGYGVQIALSTGATQSAKPNVGKRTDLTQTSLMGSGTPWTFTSGGRPIINVLDTRYTLTLKLERIADDQMQVTFAIADAGGVFSTHSMLDSSGIYTDFEQLFFRFNTADTASDIIDFHRFRVEYITK